MAAAAHGDQVGASKTCGVEHSRQCLSISLQLVGLLQSGTNIVSQPVIYGTTFVTMLVSVSQTIVRRMVWMMLRILPRLLIVAVLPVLQ